MIFLLLACATSDQPSQSPSTIEAPPSAQQNPAPPPNRKNQPLQQGQNGPQGGPPKGGPPKGAPQMVNQLPAAANPQNAWSTELAAAVPQITAQNACPDSDGDGFPDARQCTTQDSAQLDCDDSNPNVTRH